MRPRLVIGLALALAGGLLLPVAATQPAAAEGPPIVLRARMTGVQEVPPADPDGLGFAIVTVLAERRTVCYLLTATNITPATAAHIHRAPRGQNGPIVIPFDAPTSGSVSGCATDIDAALIQGLISNPGAYYVNVHNAPFPGGAIRGQLVGVLDIVPE